MNRLFSRTYNILVKHFLIMLWGAYMLLPLVINGQNRHVKYIDIKNGLSNNSVLTSFQDSEGYMWFGTYDGLNKYDGYTFKVYKNQIGDSTSLSGNTVYAIAEDAKGNIWVGNARGASRLNVNSDAFDKLYYMSAKAGKKIVMQDAVRQVGQLADGTMLLGTQNYGAVYFKNETITGIQIPLNFNGQTYYNYDVESILFSKTAICYIAVRNVGVFGININTMQQLSFFPLKTQVYCLANFYKEDVLWIGTEDGLKKLNIVTGEFVDDTIVPKSIITSIMEDASGKCWITTDGRGVYCYHKEEATAKAFNKVGGSKLSVSNSFFDVFEDKQHNLWFASLRAGISLLSKYPQQFKRVCIQKGTETSALDNYVLSFCEDEKNNGLWIGTDGAGLNYWDRTTNTFKQFVPVNALSSIFVTGITIADADNLWVSTWNGGLNKVNIHTKKVSYFKCYNPYTGQTEKNIWLVFKDADNDVWVSATNEGTLYKFNKTEQVFEVFDKDLHNLQSLIQTTDGKLWGGDYNSVVCIDKKTASFKRYQLGYPVRTLMQDSKGNLWVGTQEGGLLLFNTANGTFKRFTMADGLPDNTILRILEDAKGNLWMSTYNGLTRFNKTDVFRNFSESDGLQSNQFSFNAGLKMKSGEMVFGGINGFNIFKPEQIEDVGGNRTIKLNEIWINNKTLENDNAIVTVDTVTNIKQLSLSYFQTSVSLEFVSIDFLHPDKINYAYKLEGWDDNWNFKDNVRKANYSRLLEGDYAFKVKTRNDNGTWGAPVTLATITVFPPWYRSSWAYIGYLLVLLGVVYGYVRYSGYKERLKYEVRLANIEAQKERELADKQTAMFTYITHEFRTPLTLIINPLKKAVKKMGGDVNTDISVAHRNAKRLLSLIDHLLIFRKAESDVEDLKVSAIAIENLVTEIFKCFEYRATAHKIDYQLHINVIETTIYGDYEKLEIVLFNLLSNAFKFTANGGQIIFEVVEEEGKVLFKVSDNGCGIHEEDLQHIFEKFYRTKNKKDAKTGGFGIGLYTVKYFVEKHLGAIYCTSKQGEGASFTVALLKGYSHFGGAVITEEAPKMTPLMEELLGINVEDKKKLTEIPQTEVELITDKRKMVVVEDDEEMRNYLHKIFSEMYVVYSAINGEDGLALIKKVTPDVVLSDVNMDVMDGIEMCEKLKTDNAISHIPIVLLTSSKNPEYELKGLTNGADDYVTKPFDNEILFARIETLLKSRSQLRRYYLDSITLKENNYKVPEEYRTFLTKCIEIIEANLTTEDFKIKEFSNAMGMSHSSLYKKIKAISGQTASGFIRSVRLRHAALLLLTTNITISEAGSRVGIEDQKYFRRKFVELFGVTPSQYIKKYRDSFNKELNVVRDHE